MLYASNPPDPNSTIPLKLLLKQVERRPILRNELGMCDQCKSLYLPGYMINDWCHGCFYEAI